MKEFINNSRKICQIIKLIVENSHYIIRKLVIPTYDVPKDVLGLDQKDELFFGEQSFTEFEDKKEEGTGDLLNMNSINSNRMRSMKLRGTMHLMG